ncbi:hypothetical protein BHE74_00012319 [Ensete ventricosum]|nr:hypothetical protein BHE74_00012319 [Ensete ventricosum]
MPRHKANLWVHRFLLNEPLAFPFSTGRDTFLAINAYPTQVPVVLSAAEWAPHCCSTSLYSPIREAQAQQVLLHLRLDSRGAAVPEHEIHLGKCGNNNQDDPSPTFRRSCRDVICGSCAMNIDGDHGLVCFTEIPSFCRACTVEPWLKIARRIGRSWTGRTSLSSAPAAAPSIPAIGGILRLISRPRPSSTPTDIQNSIARLRAS